MDFLDYRERLNIGFNDKQKQLYFTNKILNIFEALCIDGHSRGISVGEYFKFCEFTGTRINYRLANDGKSLDLMKDCFRILKEHTADTKDFIVHCVSLINSIDASKITVLLNREWLIQRFEKAINDSHIPYESVVIDGAFYVFPKGASELDSALVSEPLEWLYYYPQARNTFVIALRQYSEGVYIRDVADNLRKALETFLQEFLSNTKNLETNKDLVCKYLGSQGVDAGISGLFQPLINAYKNINDRIAKHNDRVDKKILEFLLYQTGLLIRMVLSVKAAEDHNNAD